MKKAVWFVFYTDNHCFMFADVKYPSISPVWSLHLKFFGSPWLKSPSVHGSALIFCLSDGWNQAVGGFVLTDVVDGESIHRLGVYGPQVGGFWLICKPCLFFVCLVSPCFWCGWCGWRLGWSALRSSFCWRNGTNVKNGRGWFETGRRCGRTASGRISDLRAPAQTRRAD